MFVCEYSDSGRVTFPRIPQKTMKAPLILVLAALLPGILLQAGADMPQTNKDWRRSALERQRRVIFNNDGNDPITKSQSVSVKELLRSRTQALAGTQVDVISYCTFCAGFGNFTHFTKVGNVFTTTEAPFSRNKTAEYFAAGIDPLAVMVDFAHANNKECFWSMRMNDTHDASLNPQGQGIPLFRSNPLKQKHPEYLMGRPDENPRRPSWSAVNYGVPEVRELAFRFFEEVCRNYDIDGVEMDFFRHPVFFKATTDRKPVTDVERAQMTELLRRIRQMADETGRKRGRPILIAARVPDSVEYCADIGLELEKWMAGDLIDILIVSGYFQINDWEYSVALAKKYGLQVYASLDESRLADEVAKKRRGSDLAYLGRAANAWSAGMNGVYIFNLFDPRRSIWNEIGAPESLMRLDKDYFASIRGPARAAGGNLAYKQYQRAEVFSPDASKAIAPGKNARARLRVGESLAANTTAVPTLRLVFAKPPAWQKIAVQINGRKLGKILSTGELADKPAKLDKSFKSGWHMTLGIEPAQIIEGYNDITVTLDASARAPVIWSDAILEVRHPASH